MREKVIGTVQTAALSCDDHLSQMLGVPVDDDSCKEPILTDAATSMNVGFHVVPTTVTTTQLGFLRFAYLRRFAVESDNDCMCCCFKDLPIIPHFRHCAKTDICCNGMIRLLVGFILGR